MNFLFSFMLAGFLASLALLGEQTAGTLKQGIQGKVIIREGNHMPGPGKFNPTGKEKTAPRQLLVYTRTNLSQVQTRGSFYTHIQTRLVAKVTCRAEGSFQLFLKPGRYSLFSKESGGLFANSFDGEGNIFPVTVKAGQVTPVTFVIDYKASY